MERSSLTPSIFLKIFYARGFLFDNGVHPPWATPSMFITSFGHSTTCQVPGRGPSRNGWEDQEGHEDMRGGGRAVL